MKTRLSILPTALLALAACAENNASIEIAAICAPPDDAAACSFSSTCDAQAIGISAIDLSQTWYLWMFLQINNRLPDNGDLDVGRVNTNDAWVNEYVVTYDGLAIPETRGPVLGSAWIPADGSAVISVLPVNGYSGPLLAAMLPAGSLDVVARLRLRGVYGDTTEFETGEFAIPFLAGNGGIGPPPTCTTAGEVLAVCPQWGQTPVSWKCAAP